MSQKTQLNQILNQQFKNNNYYSNIRIALITALYISLVDGGNLNKRIKRIVGDNPDDAILAMIAIILLMYKRNKNLKDSPLIAETIEHKHILEQTHAEAYKEQRKIIGEEKEAFIISDLQANAINKKWFYLCSSHADSAKDHKDWQGKIYIDDNCDDPKCLALAQQYHMKSYQWVIGKPVWMVTRPNCRHYFKALTYNEVVGKSYESLIKEHNMHKTIGDRPIMQTLRGGENVDVIIKSYEERLKLHIAMNKARPNEFLKRAIDKDRLLLKKWHLRKENNSIK